MLSSGVLCLLFFFIRIHTARSHARFMEPPSRASMWRFGFKTPKDYNDNEGFCGGLQRMIENGGCGICGDGLHEPQPRQHEFGGKYGKGIITRRYKSGQDIDLYLDVTVNHKGYFRFNICPDNDTGSDPPQSCFDLFPLPIYPQMDYTVPSLKIGRVELKAKLPPGLTCNHCIIQWEYIAGNNYGICKNGTGAVGCGPQETFRGCSDVSVLTDNGMFSINKQPQTTTTTTTIKKTSVIVPTIKKGALKCRATRLFQYTPGMDNWCNINCNYVNPFCPSSHCKCFRHKNP